MKRSSTDRRPSPNRCSFASGIPITVAISSDSSLAQPFGSAFRASSRLAAESRRWAARQAASLAGISLCGDCDRTGGRPPGDAAP